MVRLLVRYIYSGSGQIKDTCMWVIFNYYNDSEILILLKLLYANRIEYGSIGPAGSKTVLTIFHLGKCFAICTLRINFT